jgi:bacterioferritin (cytochrome b1)
MEKIFALVVKDNNTHARWLNTLSMMENTGAKKFKKCEHPVFATEMILKHAAEEARHAYYLKKQIQKIAKNSCPTMKGAICWRPNELLLFACARY